MTDEAFIRKTLKLAVKGRGRVSPNPLVGAIITKNNRLLGQGFHPYFGGEHAEIVALNSATEEVTGGTLYINLEPCSHYGKQPPCVDRIVESGIKKVVIGTRDPNPSVNGKGIEFLRNHNVEVEVGVLEEECKQLNEAFFKHITTGLPFTTLKIAQTLDGKIAASDGSSKWITSDKARTLAHRMRSENDAILVGIGTVLSDNPSLNVRLTKGVNPRRIVLDSRLRIPLNASLLCDSLVEKTIVVTTPSAPQEKLSEIKKRGAQVWTVPADNKNQVHLKKLLNKIGQEKIASLLVEGGSLIFSAFLKEKLVDRLSIFLSPKILGGGLDAISDLGINNLQHALRLADVRIQQIEEEVLISGRVV